MPANPAAVQVQVQDSHCGVVWSNIAKVTPVETTPQIAKTCHIKTFQHHTTPHNNTTISTHGGVLSRRAQRLRSPRWWGGQQAHKPPRSRPPPQPTFPQITHEFWLAAPQSDKVDHNGQLGLVCDASEPGSCCAGSGSGFPVWCCCVVWSRISGLSTTNFGNQVIEAGQVQDQIHASVVRVLWPGARRAQPRDPGNLQPEHSRLSLSTRSRHTRASRPGPASSVACGADVAGRPSGHH
jgi:hypothetical protein